MGMNETPSADRVHIGFFGRRNAGKSSIVNKVTGQELAVVSDVKGTFSLYWNGEFVTHEIPSEKKFEKLLTDRGL